MPVVNATIAAIFDEIADLLDIQGANPFRVRAYRNAARTIGELGTDVRNLVKGGTALTDIPGIGEDLAHKVEELHQSFTNMLDLHQTCDRADRSCCKRGTTEEA